MASVGYAEQKESKGYSSGMIAAFVIVGIIVLAFLVLIILAVTLPARYWGCKEENGNGGISPNNVVGAPSPAAAMMIAGMGNVISHSQQTEHAMRSVPMGGSVAHNMAPAFNVAKPTLTQSFVQSANVPMVMNTLGAAQTALPGTVTAAQDRTFGSDTMAPPSGHDMLIAGPHATVGASFVMSERTAAEARDPFFGTILQGLQNQSLTIAGAQTVPQMISGAAHNAANHQGQPHHQGQQKPLEPPGVITSQKQAKEAFNNQVLFQKMQGGKVFIAVFMQGCQHCTNLYHAIQQHAPHKFIMIDQSALHIVPSNVPALAALVEQFKKQKPAYPQIYCMKGNPQYENYVVGTPVMGYSPQQGIQKLMEQAESQCNGQ